MRATLIRVGHHHGEGRSRASDYPSVFGWDDVVAMRMKAETTENTEVDDKLIGDLVGPQEIGSSNQESRRMKTSLWI